MLGRTATETATSVELLDRLVEMALRQVRVAQRHRERLVPHQLADAVQIHTLHRQPRGERVPEVVPPEVLDSRLTDRRVEDALSEVRRVSRRLASPTWEDPVAVKPARQRAQ